jgi:hypothetical protein
MSTFWLVGLGPEDGGATSTLNGPPANAGEVGGGLGPPANALALAVGAGGSGDGPPAAAAAAAAGGGDWPPPAIEMEVGLPDAGSAWLRLGVSATWG